MPYQYGMQNSPSGGNGLGGLPKKQTTPERSTYIRIVTAGGGMLTPPANAKYMRVAVIGGGGGGQVSGATNAMSGYGGGGGGCAATKIIPAAVINYTVGAGGVGGIGAGTVANGKNSTASFAGYSLVGGAGVPRFGGVGSGGDYNFKGGDTPFATSDGSLMSGGGGAAGPSGNGGNGVQVTSPYNSGTYTEYGWGVGGGGGGGIDGNGYATGGSGSGATSTSANVTDNSSNPLWGKFGSRANGSSGGEMGGGGGAMGYIDGYPKGNGGVGGIVVEWFY
jgi:hypothetical protein